MTKGQTMSQEQKDKTRETREKNKEKKQANPIEKEEVKDVEVVKEMKITVPTTDEVITTVPSINKEEVITDVPNTKTTTISTDQVVEVNELDSEKVYKLDRNIKMNGETYPKGTEFKKNDVIKDVQKYLI